jgi:phospho-N-acetylmuramoyl-pentapeptide-transferase
MLYYLFDWLDRAFDFPGAGVFQYLTFRATAAALLSVFISLFIGRRLILYLRRKLIGETIRTLGPETHKKKAGTPTMGGLVILTAIVVPTVLLADLRSPYVWLILLATVWMGLIGFLDDYIKVVKKNKAGLKGRFKVVGQVVLGLIVGLTLVLHPDFSGRVRRTNEEGVVRANELLRAAGFQNGDKIVKANDKPFATLRADPSTVAQHLELKPNFYRTYRVQRALPGGGTEEVLLRVDTVPDVVMAQLIGLVQNDYSTQTDLPFVKSHRFDYGDLAFWTQNVWVSRILYILVCIFVVTAVSNGVNITDGLDGLAAGTSAIVGICLALFAYLSGNAIFANYLNISYIPTSGELFIYAAAFVAACIGFLWYNAHPAQVFMGDTGSLALGSAIAVMALMVKKELLLPIICGVFLVENLSVMLQVGYFKYTKRKYGEGRRIFRMSPLHHHYELQGWHEAKITTRFWIVNILLVLLAFATLKLR